MLCEREIARKDHRRIDMAVTLANFPAVKRRKRNAFGCGEKIRDRLSLIGTNSGVVGPCPRGYREPQTVFEILCNHVKMTDEAFYNR
jgi:hypothetical protein